MRKKVLNRLRIGQPIAAEVNASSPVMRSWVVVYPPAKAESGFLAEDSDCYRVEFFEARIDELHFDDFLTHNERVLTSRSEEELFAILNREIGDTDILDAPWYCDCPI